MSPAAHQSHSDIERRVTAYHEAGHARAAAHAGGRIDGIDISYTPQLTRGWTAVDVPELTDIAFYAYAGSWAQTRLLTPAKCDDLDAVWALVRTNSDDWAEIQRALGRTVTDSDTTGAQIWGIENRTTPLPGELRPDDATLSKMHANLDGEWATITELAGHLLAGNTPIAIGTGPDLVKVSESRWLRPHYIPPESLNTF
jgi:hypothetical protein